MKKRSSLRTAKLRHKACKVVRRGKKLVVLNKLFPRFKVTQGSN